MFVFYNKYWIHYIHINVKLAHIYGFTVRPDSFRPFRDRLNKKDTNTLNICEIYKVFI